MAKASVVSAQQQNLLREINEKLDLLLEKGGIQYQPGTPGEPPKPIKTFVRPAEQPALPAEPEPVKPAKKGK